MVAFPSIRREWFIIIQFIVDPFKGRNSKFFKMALAKKIKRF
jgi:hypothetical protein